MVTNYGATKNITTIIKEITMYTILNATSKIAVATYQNVTVVITKNIKPRYVIVVTIINSIITTRSISCTNLFIFVVVNPIVSYTDWTFL